MSKEVESVTTNNNRMDTFGTSVCVHCCERKCEIEGQRLTALLITKYIIWLADQFYKRYIELAV